jgi:hypothetical protein
MTRIPFAILSLLALAMSACTWVETTPDGNHVRVAYDGNVSGCRDAGAITVSVADKVGLYHRPELKVRDELETLARNQAADMPADTIKPTSEPRDGAQNFEAYVCGRGPARERAARRADDAGGAETYPVH